MQTRLKFTSVKLNPLHLEYLLFYCTLPEYYDEGFLSLQHAINLALIKEIDASSESEVDDMRIQDASFPISALR